MRRLGHCVAVAVASFLLSAAAQAVELAAHSAEYDLKLESSRGGDVISGTGHMSYEVTDACDGWATRQRLEMDITNSAGQDIQTLSDYTTYESKDGLSLRFRMKQITEDATTSEVEGTATLERAGGSGTVHYTLPEAVDKHLPAGTLFPTTHTEAILNAARAGKKFLTLPLFDGTSASGPSDSTVVLNVMGKTPVSAWPDLAAHPSVRVHIAFFDQAAHNQEPDYEVSLRYFDNGVADGLSMDFGDFVMGGKLVSLKVSRPAC